MPKYDFCNSCGTHISQSSIPWLPAFDGLCGKCRTKVGERHNKAVSEFERSLRSDNVSEYEIGRLSKKFREGLAREE